MKVGLLLNDPQNIYGLCTTPHTIIGVKHHHVFSCFNCQPYSGRVAEMCAFLSQYGSLLCAWLLEGFVLHVRRK